MRLQRMLRVAACAATLTVYAELDPGSYAFIKDITVPGAIEAEAIVSFDLDAQVHAGTRPDWPDLRVLDDAGTEVPMLLARATRLQLRLTPTRCSTEVMSLKPLPDNRIEVHVRLKRASAFAEKIRFVTPLKDYERRIRVSGRNPDQGWTPLVHSAVIYDYSRFMDVTKTDVDLPHNRYREFRIEIDNVTDEQASALVHLTRQFARNEPRGYTEGSTVTRRPLRIDRIEFWHMKETELAPRPRLAAYPLRGYTVTHDTDAGRTEIAVDTDRQPLTSLTILTESRNFSRHAYLDVEQPDRPGSAWRRIAQTRLTRIRLASLAEEHLAFDFAEQRAGKYRITIDNADNPPLSITGVAAKGPTYEMTFLAAHGRRYRLLYGAATVDKPVYDTAEVLAPVRRQTEPTPATLGEERPNPEFDGPRLDLHGLLDHRAAFVLAVVIVIAVLGCGLYRAVQRVDGHDAGTS